MPNHTGRELNKKWGVNANQALYRDIGNWFHRLTRFPGALFDSEGYVVFQTEDEYLNCPFLQIKKQTSCPKRISAIPSYVQVVSFTTQASDLAEPEKTTRVSVTVNRVVRDSLLVRRIKKLHCNKCQVCGLRLMFSENESYAEGHHIQPLGSDHHGPDVSENILCVCPNCHAQLDYGAVKLTRAKLQIVSEHDISEKYIDYHNQQIFRG